MSAKDFLSVVAAIALLIGTTSHAAGQHVETSAARPVTIEVGSAEGFMPLNMGLVRTLTPAVRITVNDAVQGDLQVVLDDGDPSTPILDISANFPDLEIGGTDQAVLTVLEGRNQISILANGQLVAAAAMLNFTDDSQDPSSFGLTPKSTTPCAGKGLSSLSDGLNLPERPI